MKTNEKKSLVYESKENEEKREERRDRLKKRGRRRRRRRRSGRETPGSGSFQSRSAIDFDNTSTTTPHSQYSSLLFPATMSIPPPPPKWAIALNSPMPRTTKESASIPNPPGFSSTKPGKQVLSSPSSQSTQSPIPLVTNIKRISNAPNNNPPRQNPPSKPTRSSSKKPGKSPSPPRNKSP